ncbi:BtpA/SgcQ family protein [Myxococcota bacterium]|nr:BtpA/SgcQ family protein [Myxococcota bacterium]
MARVFEGPSRVVAMIHVGALPGTPRASAPIDALVERAVAEARVYRDAGVDAILVENMHDVPYLKGGVGPEITAAMTRLAHAVKVEARLPTGIQILAAANREALAVALAAGLDFVRVEGFVFAHVADEGWIDGCAGALLRYRRAIGAEHVAVLADIKKKHSSHAVTADVSLEETAHAAELFAADGVIVTGAATGMEASVDEVRAVRATVHLPVLVGSGVTTDNVHRYLPHTSGLIIGSHFKAGGRWDAPVDPARVGAFMAKVAALRGAST